MNNSLPEDRVMKAFAIIGLVVLVIVLAWIAVQVIQFIPRGFSSLASLADSVYNDEEPASLEVTASDDTVSSEQGVSIEWTDVGVRGSYAFTYDCVDGVTATVQVEDHDAQAVACDTPFVFDAGVYDTAIVFTSVSEPTVDVTYSITFTPENTDFDVREITRMITLTNDSLVVIEQEPEETEAEELPDTGLREEESVPEVRYRTVETPIYALPKSDPNGYTELKATFLASGTVSGNNVFSEGTVIEAGDRGAIQFEVKNIGTKTSTDWNYRATLPFAQRYDAPEQEALKPNERAVVTLVFDAIDEGVEDIEVRISGGNDQSTGNNNFSRSVIITD